MRSADPFKFFGDRDIFMTYHIEGILPKGPYPPYLRMADRAHLAGYPRYIHRQIGII